MVVVRRGAAQAAGRARPRRVRGRGVVQRRRSRAPRVPALHAPGGVPRLDGARTCCSPATTSEIRKWRREQQPRAWRRRATAAVRYHEPPARAVAAGARARSFFAMSTVIDSLERAQLRRVPQLPAGRPRPRPLPGHRGHAPPHPGLRGRRHQAPGPRRARDLHGPQAVLRRRRRAHVPAALAEDREDRGRRPRRRPAREALLPARPRRQARPRARAPLHRPGGGRRAPGCCTIRPRRLEAEARRSAEAIDAEGETADGGRRRGGAAETAAERRGRRPTAEPRRRGGRRGRGRRGGAPAEAEADAEAEATAARRARRRRHGVKTEAEVGRRLARSSWSSSSRSRSASRWRSRPSSSSRTGSRASRWCRRSRSASACSSTASATRFSDPQVGDIVVFHPPDGRRARTPVRRPPAAAERRPATEPTPSRAERELHQARRRRPGRHDLRSSDGHVDPSTASAQTEPFIAPVRRRRRTATSRSRSRFRPATTS